MDGNGGRRPPLEQPPPARPLLLQVAEDWAAIVRDVADAWRVGRQLMVERRAARRRVAALEAESNRYWAEVERLGFHRDARDPLKERWFWIVAGILLLLATLVPYLLIRYGVFVIPADR